MHMPPPAIWRFPSFWLNLGGPQMMGIFAIGVTLSIFSCFVRDHGPDVIHRGKPFLQPQAATAHVMNGGGALPRLAVIVAHPSYKRLCADAAVASAPTWRVICVAYLFVAHFKELLKGPGIPNVFHLLPLCLHVPSLCLQNLG
jgi:hypothetical protein